MERVDRQMVDVTPEPAPLLPAIEFGKRDRPYPQEIDRAPRVGPPHCGDFTISE
jgi:hypothetical protein